jgi:group I intron endonuclease
MYYTYKTTNNINGNYYLGFRKCPPNHTPETDWYYGSGLLLSRAIKKHGKENFTKIVLKCFECKEDAAAHEKEIVTLKEVKDRKCYNLRIGGVGGGMPGELNHAYGYKHTEENKKSNSERAKKRWKEGKYEKARSLWSEQRKGKGNSFYGKSHTKEYIEKRLMLWAKKNGCTYYHSITGEFFWTKKEMRRQGITQPTIRKYLSNGILIKEIYHGDEQ